MYLRGGRYYRVTTVDGRQKWIALSRDLEESLALFEMSKAGRAVPPPLRTARRMTEDAYRAQVMAWLPRVVNNVRRSAMTRGCVNEMTLTVLGRLALDQQFRCAVTGMKFADMSLDESRQRPYVPSVDRIDCRLGYTLANCRLVLAAVNVAMNQWGESVFASIAIGYARHTKRREVLEGSKNEPLIGQSRF